MKRYSISGLASMLGLSRSTLLYYDRIGVLPPSGRTGSGYRFYTEADRRRLERICHFRQAGLTLQEIRAVLNSGGKPGSKLIEKRMRETSEAILGLRSKQRLLARMLRSASTDLASLPVDKKLWVEMLRAAGMNDQAMARWHSEFERRSPEGHQEFLTSLGISAHEAARIREWSRRLGQ